jgi:hypothetical protein
MFEILGIAGVAISVAAYVPQVVHLGREHCSAGVSSRAWAMWLVSSLLIGALALHRREPVFIALQVINLTSISLTLLLARRYRGMVCEFHAHPNPSRSATITGGKGGSASAPACGSRPAAVRVERRRQSSSRVTCTRLRLGLPADKTLEQWVDSCQAWISPRRMA